MKVTPALTLFLALALLGFVLLALSAPTARAADPVVVRVTTSGTTGWPCGQGDWSNPCALQTALSNTVAGSELWVAAGTYTPTTTETDPRLATFQLRDGVALYGGFAGGETLRSQRNFTANVTILSGDINGNDNSNVRYDEPTRAENAYHVVTASGVTNTAVLDGFTVTGGNSNFDGGGIYNNSASPTLSNVILANNSAHFYGGGMAISNGSSTLTNVTLSNNSAGQLGGGIYNNGASLTLSNVILISNTAYYGGGMHNWNSGLTLSNVTFISNTVNGRGGGMYNDTSNPTLIDTVFISNWADTGSYSFSYGGGMYNWYSSSVLTNVTFFGNSASNGGGMQDSFSNSTLTNVAFISNTASGTYGGMAAGGESTTLANVTFSGNSAAYGGGLGNEKAMTLTNVTFISNTASLQGGGMMNYEGSATLTNVTFSGNSAGQRGGGLYSRNTSNPTLRNVIFWGNTAPDGSQLGNDNTSTSSLFDSVVQGGYISGTRIITTNPLLGPLGNYGGSTQTIPLLPGSSAIDAGNDAICPATDQRGVSRPQGLHCDIGAFEFEFARLQLPLIRR